VFVLRRVVGDSMLPSLTPGSIVIGMKTHRRLKVGRLVVVQHNGLEKIKRINRLEGDKVYVLGDNPGASTDSRHFGWLELKDVKAVVVWPR
jgi:nickel-type superoxide dismutase maturation protease